MSLGPQDTTVLLDNVHIWLLFCKIELYLASADGMAYVFTDSGFWMYSWAHLVMSMTDQAGWVDAVSSEGLKNTALSHTHRDFSSFSESFDDVMHCRLWLFSKPLLILTLRNVVLMYFTIFYALFHRLESLCPSLLLRDSASLRHPFLCTDRCQLTY